MTRTIFFCLVLLLPACRKTGFDPAQERTLLLASNERQREAHLRGDAQLLAAELADTIVSVQNGALRVDSREETQARFDAYFPTIRYRKWDDVTPPQIFFSQDGSQAVVVVRKIIQTTPAVPGGMAPPDATLFAWTANYRKQNGKWQIFSITSTREDLGSKTFQDFYTAGLDSLKAGHASAAVVNLERGWYLNPSNPAIQLDYARALVRSGATGQALDLLGNLAGMGFPGVYAIGTDSAFQSLAGNPAFVTLVGKAGQAAQPQNNSVVYATLPERDLIPEGLAYDERSGAVFLSSTYKRKIVRIDRDGRVSDFVTAKQDGIWSTIGMEVDEDRGVLWVATAHANAVLPLIDPEPENEWKTAVFKYDLADGHLIKAYHLYNTSGQPRFFNDLTVSRTGDVYITETGNADLYRIPLEGDTLGLFYHELDGRTFYNGLALSADQRYLYVAHAEGILRLDVVTREVREVEHPSQVTLQGVDGLAMYNGSLIAHQSSLLNRLMRYRLDEPGLRVIAAEVLEANNPYFDQSSTGELTGDGGYVYLANAQMHSAFDWDRRRLKPFEQLKEVVILKIEGL